MQSRAVQGKNENLASGNEDVQRRWTEHFKEVLDGEEPPNIVTVDNES